MEKLHRHSNGGAITLSGLRGVILRSSGTTNVRTPDGPKALPSFTFRPGINAEAMTIVWNNPHGLAIVEEHTVETLLARRWGAEVPDSVLDAWNKFVEDGEEPILEPELDLKMVATAPTPTAQTVVEPSPVAPPPPAPEPKPETPKAATPAPKPAPEPAKAVKPAATKEELLKRAEEEAAKAKDK